MKSKKKNFFFFNKNKSISVISRIFLSSFIIVAAFYAAPLIVNFAKENLYTIEFKNNSKKILAYKLKNEDETKEEVENFNEEDLLIDIFNLNDLESDTVRLSASTIKQLFEDTGYNLKDVRKKKLVKPVALTLLPEEIKRNALVLNKKDKKRKINDLVNGLGQVKV